MHYIARASKEYIEAGVGNLPEKLNIKLTRRGAYTVVEGNVFSLISFFTALASHYHLSLAEIREKFA